jgi:transposase
VGALQRLQSAFNSLRERYRAVVRERNELRGRVKLLESRLAQYESVEEEQRAPPSFVKPKVEAKERKKPGAPEGHKGVSRPRPKDVDDEVVEETDTCPECGHDELRPLEDDKIRVITDIIPARAIHIRVVQKRYWCPGCKKRVLARSKHALPRKRLGINLAAYAAFLRTENIPYGRILTIFREMFMLKLAKRTLIEAVREVKETLKPEYLKMKKNLRRARVVNGDETSYRMDGKNWWLWALRSRKSVVFVVRNTRGREVPLEVLGKDFTGTTMSDGWAAWFFAGGNHQLCFNHINQMLRKVEVKYRIKERGYMELKAPEYLGAGRPPEEFIEFAAWLREWMHDVAMLVKRNPTKEERRRALHGFRVSLGRLLAKKWKNVHAARIVRFLAKHREKLLWTVELPGVPFHNNAAERALRSSVVARKISYGSKSSEGVQAHEVLRSVTETQVLRGRNPLHHIQREMRLRVSRGMPQL